MTTGNSYDPIWEAYEAGTPERQHLIRDLFATTYTNGEMAAALTYVLATDVTERHVEVFKRKLAQGRVAW